MTAAHRYFALLFVSLGAFFHFEDLDVHIGLPLSENYRTAKSEESFLADAEDWNAFLFENGVLNVIEALFPREFSFMNLIDDMKDNTWVNEVQLKMICWKRPKSNRS